MSILLDLLNARKKRLAQDQGKFQIEISSSSETSTQENIATKIFLMKYDISLGKFRERIRREFNCSSFDLIADNGIDLMSSSYKSNARLYEIGVFNGSVAHVRVKEKISNRRVVSRVEKTNNIKEKKKKYALDRDKIRMRLLEKKTIREHDVLVEETRLRKSTEPIELIVIPDEDEEVGNHSRAPLATNRFIMEEDLEEQEYSDQRLNATPIDVKQIQDLRVSPENNSKDSSDLSQKPSKPMTPKNNNLKEASNHTQNRSTPRLTMSVDYSKTRSSNSPTPILTHIAKLPSPLKQSQSPTYKFQTSTQTFLLSANETFKSLKEKYLQTISLPQNEYLILKYNDLILQNHQTPRTINASLNSSNHIEIIHEQKRNRIRISCPEKSISLLYQLKIGLAIMGAMRRFARRLGLRTKNLRFIYESTGEVLNKTDTLEDLGIIFNEDNMVGPTPIIKVEIVKP